VQPDLSVNLTILLTIPISFSAVTILLWACIQSYDQIRMFSWQSSEISSWNHPKHIICLLVGTGQYSTVHCNIV
jgi:hypothetical protein